jgi:hypothetical protein
MHWFDRVTAELAAKHRVIRVDLLGHGCTTAATHLDAEAQAHAMSAVLQRLGTHGATAVGHSFGADVVLAHPGCRPRSLPRRVLPSSSTTASGVRQVDDGGAVVLDGGLEIVVDQVGGGGHGSSLR